VNARSETQRARTRWIWREPGPDLRRQAAFVGGRQGLALGAGEAEEPGGVGLREGETGNPVDHLGTEGDSREIGGEAVQTEDLGRVGEREVAD